jgi:predicted NBD/HSP70 family sugar kinase
MAIGGTSTITDARSLLWQPSDSLREVNRRKIIRAVMVEPATQAVIARLTRLSPATVSGVVGELQQEGVVRVDGGEGGRGKKVRLGPVRGVTVGMELTQRGAAVAARRVADSSIEYESVAFSADQGGNGWVRESVRLIKDLVAQTGLDENDIVSIGIGVPAAVDPRRGAVTQIAAEFDWDLRGGARERFNDHFPGVPVIIDNAAHFAAYGEFLHGAGRGQDIMLYVNASTRIGAGLVIEGSIYRGQHGLGCELGHVTMDPLGIMCRCGSRGCLETLVGGARLVEQVRQAFPGYRVDLPSSLESMIERAKSGDRVCLRVLVDAARNIGLALACACNLLNPGLIVLGGEMGRAADLLIDPLLDGLWPHCLPTMVDSPSPTTVVGSELGLAAGARGALAFALMVDGMVT